MSALRHTVLFCFLLLVFPATGNSSPVVAGKTDKCPVCGMFVAKYQDFLGQIIFTDGSYALFDGSKDMFKYYFDIKRYNPTKALTDIAHIYVTDYYSVTVIDGRKAWFVTGSDVFGPMGRELIPFAKESEAKEFMKDHAGKKVLPFAEVTPEILKELD
jgi:copper chaperone NosL